MQEIDPRIKHYHFYECECPHCYKNIDFCITKRGAQQILKDMKNCGVKKETLVKLEFWLRKENVIRG